MIIGARAIDVFAVCCEGSVHREAKSCFLQRSNGAIDFNADMNMIWIFFCDCDWCSGYVAN